VVFKFPFYYSSFSFLKSYYTPFIHSSSIKIQYPTRLFTRVCKFYFFRFFSFATIFSLSSFFSSLSPSLLFLCSLFSLGFLLKHETAWVCRLETWWLTAWWLKRAWACRSRPGFANLGLGLPISAWVSATVEVYHFSLPSFFLHSAQNHVNLVASMRFGDVGLFGLGRV
jgi:hypothetical protein